MALDPNIILQGQTQAPQQPNPLTSIATIADVQAQVAQRNAAAQNAMSLAQQRINAARDEALISAAQQQFGGDDDKAIAWLGQNGNERAQNIYATRVADARQKTSAAIEAGLKTTGAKIDLGAQALNGLDADPTPARYAVTRDTILNLTKDGPLAGAFNDALPANLTDPSQIADATTRARAISQPQSTYLAALTTAQEKWRAGDQRGSIATALSAAQTPQAAQGLLALYKKQGAPDDVLAPFVSAIAAGASPDAIAKLGETPKEQADIANEAAARAQAAATATETARAHRATEAIEGGNLAVARAREAREAASGLMPDGTASPAVMQYADDVKSGKIPLTAVPDAGHVRDAVQTYLRKQGLDLTQPLTAQVRARYEFASSVLPQVSQVENLAQQMQAQGLMGTFSGRLRDASSAESAAAAMTGLTPAQQRLVGQFATQADLLASGVAMAHFGARGGSQADEMRKQLTAGGKSLDTFLGNLAAAKSVLQGYANDLPSSGSSAAAPAAAGRVRVKGPNGQSGTVPSGSVSTLPAGWSVVP